MRHQMLHIFRNTPFGRETLLQSVYFCQKQPGLSLAIYIPSSSRFSMRFDTDEVIVCLDGSYLRDPGTARAHVREIVDDSGVAYEFYTPTEFGAADLPELATDFAFMACPRVVSEQSSRIGLGHIGPKVRSIVKEAPFAVLIPSMNHKPWTNVAVFFGGSPLGARAVELGLNVAQAAGVPVAVHTQLEGTTRTECERLLADMRLLDRLREAGGQWEVFSEGSFEQNLYAVPHDALVVIGAAGHRLIQELVFGSKLEKVQSTLPNPLLVLGPRWRSTSAD